ncbi:MAG: DsrE family protein [Candidatus Nanosalina sp.]
MKAVFHFSSPDTDRVSELLGNLKNLREDETVDMESIAVVMNGDGVKFARKNSEASEYFSEELSEDIEIKVCSNSLEGRGIDSEELLDGVEVVSSGVGELNRLQDRDYNYIRP